MAAASIITSVITGGSNSHQTVAEELNTFATDFVTQGIVGTFTANTGSGGTGSFCVNADSSPDMGVTVLSGQAYVSGTPSGQDAQVLRARMNSNYTAYTINSNSSGSTKYDWIYLQLSAANANNPSSAADNVITLFTSRSTSNTSDNGSPPTYGLLLAVVTVVNGASSITNSNITDKRVACVLASTTSNAVNTGWNTLSYALTYGANNGNKEFTVTTPYDLRGILSAGMKLNVTRSVTPPTQSMAFASASSQYATVSSPAGITFTSAFTCEAWVYLQSYTGQNQVIINREDGSGTAGGWALYINSSGQVRIEYGTTTNFTNIQTYQSIPLNQWVHVAGVITSVSSKTGAIYINGASVSTNSPNSASTTLTQASVDLRIGAFGNTPANSYFNGYVSEARVWSVAQSAASIQSNMAINLVGNESNLVALFKGNGNFNDATSNANNLTAQAGAIATQASNPYNATEYANVVAVSYSNPTTTITLNTGTSGAIPNQTLNSPQYSVAKNPYGLPSNLTKYVRYVPICANFVTSATSQTQVSGLSSTITIPTGSPAVRISVFGYAITNSGANFNFLGIWDGTVGSGTQISQEQNYNNYSGMIASAVVYPSSGSHTYNAGLHCNAGTVTYQAATLDPGYLLIECDL